MARTSSKAKKTKQEVTKNQKDDTEKQSADEHDESEKTEENYEVEKIIHSRIFRGKRQYLIRWKGYDEGSDTWENESAVESCPEALEDFQKNNAINDDDSENEQASKENMPNKRKSKAKEGDAKYLKPKNQTKQEKKKQLSESEDENKDSTVDEVGPENNETDNKKTKKNLKRKGSKAASGLIGKNAKASKSDSEDEPLTDGKDYEEKNNLIKTKQEKKKQLSESEDENKDLTVDEVGLKNGKTDNKKTKKNLKRKGSKAASGTNGKNAKASKSGSDDEPLTDGKDYEVDRIVEMHSRRDGTKEFLIRWKGYSSKDDTWEPEAHLDCKDLIEKFMERVEKAKSMPMKELRETSSENKKFVPNVRAGARKQRQLRTKDVRPFYQE